MDRMEQMLAFARNCAKEAGKIQLSYFRGNHLHIETKFNMHDVVTVADKESERYIIGEIKRTYPEHAILGEESGMHAGDSEYCWVIDPLTEQPIIVKVCLYLQSLLVSNVKVKLF